MKIAIIGNHSFAMAFSFYRLTLSAREHARLCEAMAIPLRKVRCRLAGVGSCFTHESQSTGKAHPEAARCALPQACQPERSPLPTSGTQLRNGSRLRAITATPSQSPRAVQLLSPEPLAARPSKQDSRGYFADGGAGGITLPGGTTCITNEVGFCVGPNGPGTLFLIGGSVFK